MAAVAGLVGAAGVLWFLMFSPWTAQAVPFWPMMAGASVAVAGSAMAAMWAEERGAATKHLATVAIPQVVCPCRYRRGRGAVRGVFRGPLCQ